MGKLLSKATRTDWTKDLDSNQMFALNLICGVWAVSDVQAENGKISDST